MSVDCGLAIVVALFGVLVSGCLPPDSEHPAQAAQESEESEERHESADAGAGSGALAQEPLAAEKDGGDRKPVYERLSLTVPSIMGANWFSFDKGKEGVSYTVMFGPRRDVTVYRWHASDGVRDGPIVLTFPQDYRHLLARFETTGTATQPLVVPPGGVFVRLVVSQQGSLQTYTVSPDVDEMSLEFDMFCATAESIIDAAFD